MFIRIVVGIEGYREKVNCFTFSRTQALEEKISMCCKHQKFSGEEDSHPRNKLTKYNESCILFLFFERHLDWRVALEIAKA